MKIAALITCFNRRETTLACIAALLSTTLPPGASIKIFLTDDRSPDGTAKTIRDQFPSVSVIDGSGADYWAGGMRRSFSAAMNEGFDYYLWLNDDSALWDDAITRILAVASDLRQVTRTHIVVGNMCATDGKTATYGGVVFPSWWRRTTPVIVRSDSSPVRCESFNGNCVLISAKAARILGNLDPVFTHGLADFDYGLRAQQAGVPVWVVSGFVGTCDRNPATGTHLDDRLPLAKRLSRVCGSKGYPPGPWAIYTRRHCGPFWFLYWLFPYVRVFLSGKLKRPPRAVLREPHGQRTYQDLLDQ